MKKRTILKFLIIIFLSVFLVVFLYMIRLLLFVTSNDIEYTNSVIEDNTTKNDNKINYGNVLKTEESRKETISEKEEQLEIDEELSDREEEKEILEKELDNINYPKESKTIASIDPLLLNLKSNGMKFSSIKDDLGEGIELEDGYISYLDGTVKLKKSSHNIVVNIVFSRDYKERIFTNMENTDTLDEFEFFNQDYCFGSVEEGFLGYRTDELYYFIYDDEISVYGYSYSRNNDFELYLDQYLNDNDLKKFVNLTIKKLSEYDYCECDLDEEKANILFSCYGIEFRIDGNGSKGIILYNNYFFTPKTRQYVIDGLVTFNNSENTIENMEKKRRLETRN